MTDLHLLLQYEPVVRYTYGHMFFPCAVDGYLARCRLWMAGGEGAMTLPAGPGELTTSRLSQFSSVPLDHRPMAVLLNLALRVAHRQDPDRAVQHKQDVLYPEVRPRGVLI